jgi:hypothetical protein
MSTQPKLLVMAKTPHNKRRMFSQSECRFQKVQPLVNEALAAFRQAIQEGRAAPGAGINYKNYSAAIDRWYELHIAHDRRHGRSTITIGDQQWRLVFTDNSHYRSVIGKFMPDAWARMQPKQVDRLKVDRVYVQGQDGRNVIGLFRLPKSKEDGRPSGRPLVGTKYELDLSHDVWKVSSPRRRQMRREELIKEVVPLISDVRAAELARSGWWPPLKKDRPRFMARERFDAIQVELRDGKPMARRRGHGVYLFKGRDLMLPTTLPNG